jgi:hypothetical protein
MVAGTAVGSAPVIIHLLNRQRYRRITWAAMHWLLASFKKSSRRLQIEDLILLIIRILILVLLALALARPFLQESGAFLGGKSHVHRLILLDTSFSMGYGAGGKNAFSRAKETARYLTTTSTLSSGDAVTLIEMTDQAVARIKASTNLSEVFREVDGTELSHAGTDPVKALSLAFRMLDESAHPRKEIFLITDMTRNGWIDSRSGVERVRGLDDLKKAVAGYREKHPGTKLPPIFLIDVGTRNAPNAAVTALSADMNVIAAKSKVVFKAEVANHTGKDRMQLPVAFSVNGERVSSQMLDIKSGERKTAMFFHQFEIPGPHWVTVSAEPDGLPVDDSRFMAVPVVPSIKVLMIDGEEKADPFESETGLLSRALAIPVSERMASEGIRSPSIISAQVLPDSDLGDAQFEGQDLLVLANVPVIPEEKLPQIRKFVREGGALLIFVGDSVGPDLYNERLLDAKDEKGKPFPPLLPCRLVEPQGRAGDPDAQKFYAFAPDDNISGLLPTFAPPELRGYIARPQRKTPEVGVRVFRRYRVKIEKPEPEKAEGEKKEKGEATGSPAEPEKPAEKAGETEPAEKDAGEEKEKEGEKEKANGKVAGGIYVPLRYDDGEPAVVIRDYGMGRVCLVTTTADTHWTDMPDKLAFLPAMHDLVYHLVRERGRKHNLPVGGVFSVRWPAEDLLKDVVVMPPEGHEEDKRTIKPESKENITRLTYDGARWAGAYKLSIAGEGELRDVFAANVDPQESDLLDIDVEDLQRLVKVQDLKFEKIEDREKIAEALRSKASGKEFWRNLTWTVLTLAVLETFLAWFFGRHRW